MSLSILPSWSISFPTCLPWLLFPICRKQKASLQQKQNCRIWQLSLAAYSVYTKNANRWVIGGEYLHKKYDYKDMQIPVEQFTAEGGYYLKFLSDRRKTFFLSLGLSALAGYEVSNKSEKLLPDGSTLLDKDCFIYGGALTLELEAYLTDRVALLLNARERALFGSDIGKFHSQVSLGLKFIIN